ncbi:MAG: 23S rRNA (adenine(2503)-C(2))-methyltransferase RlmN [Terracidiphilus sp.]
MASDSSQLVRLDSAPFDRGSRKPLFGLDAAALAVAMEEFGEPVWRGRQLVQAIYRQWLTDLDAITTLPRPLRRRLLDAGFEIGRPQILQVFRSIDGTERYLVECQNRNSERSPESPPGRTRHPEPRAAETVETVWMPEGDDGESGDDEPKDSGCPRSGLSDLGKHDPNPTVLQDSDTVRQGKPRTRATICVSSQVGCAVNCQFCLTARLGLQRNLTAGEIAGQVIAVLDRHGVQVGRDRLNLVFMGMGEPFLNYANFMAAVRLLVREVGLSPQRMTVSTSGIVPGIEQFAQEPPDLRPRLAISLNAPNDRIRTEVMPINRKWPIDAVLDAVRRLRLRPRERITFEYVLLGGVTDRPGHAREAARLVRRSGLPAKVNLIAWNPGPEFHYTTPKPEAVERFRAALAAEGIPVYLRQPRGRDIYAACGQLKRTVEAN